MINHDLLITDILPDFFRRVQQQWSFLLRLWIGLSQGSQYLQQSLLLPQLVESTHDRAMESVSLQYQPINNCKKIILIS